MGCRIERATRNCHMNGEAFVWTAFWALPHTGMLELDLVQLRRPQVRLDRPFCFDHQFDHWSNCILGPCPTREHAGPRYRPARWTTSFDYHMTTGRTEFWGLSDAGMWS